MIHHACTYIYISFPSLEKNNARKFSYDKTVHVCEYVSRKKNRKKSTGYFIKCVSKQFKFQGPKM
jgi:hypothetical protein